MASGLISHFMPPSLLASQLATLEAPSACRFTAIRVDGAKGGSSGGGEGGPGLMAQPLLSTGRFAGAAAATSARGDGDAVTHVALSSPWALVTQGDGGYAAGQERRRDDDACASSACAMAGSDADSILLRIGPAEADTPGSAGGRAASFPSVTECVELIVAAIAQVAA